MVVMYITSLVSITISSTERVNAVLYLCRGRNTVYFFESVAEVASDFSSDLAAQALVFEVEDVALEQSQAMCWELLNLY